MPQLQNAHLFMHRITGSDSAPKIFSLAGFYRFSSPKPRTTEDDHLMREFTQLINDYADIWDEIDPSEQASADKQIMQLLNQLEQRSIWVFGLQTRELLPILQNNNISQEPSHVIANFRFAYADGNEIEAITFQ